MTNFEEDRLRQALRGPILCDDLLTNKLMDEVAAEDLHAIRPVIDEMLRNAEACGRLKAILERWAKLEEMREKREKAAA